MSTPTAAAKSVVPDYRQLAGQLERERATIRRRALQRAERGTATQLALRQRLLRRSPVHLVSDRRQFVGQLRLRGSRMLERRLQRAHRELPRLRREMHRSFQRRVALQQSRQQLAVGKLRALSPQQTLTRGYAIVRLGEHGAVVRKREQAPAGAELQVVVCDGTFAAVSSGDVE